MQTRRRRRRRISADAMATMAMMATMATMAEPLRVSGLRGLGDEVAHNPPQQGRSADNCAERISPSWRAAGSGGGLSDLRFSSHANPFPVCAVDAIASTILRLHQFLRLIVSQACIQLLAVMTFSPGLNAI